MATRFAKAVAARVGSAAVLGGGVRAARGAITAVGKRLPELVPPLEFPSRIEPIAAGSSSIDNDVYDDDTVGSSWHSDDPTDQLATLQLLNTARIPYFDRVWRQQLGLPPGRPGAYLEVGCGGGIATVALASLGYQMTGIDPAARALDEARAHARARGLADRTVFAAGDAYDLSAFPDDSFDGVLMADVMEHLLDLPAAVAEVRRVLKPGGVLVFDTINRTYKSYLAAIVLAEEVLQLVPPRVHDWRLFLKPHEAAFLLQDRPSPPHPAAPRTGSPGLAASAGPRRRTASSSTRRSSEAWRPPSSSTRASCSAPPRGPSRAASCPPRRSRTSSRSPRSMSTTSAGRSSRPSRAAVRRGRHCRATCNASAGARRRDVLDRRPPKPTNQCEQATEAQKRCN